MRSYDMLCVMDGSGGVWDCSWMTLDRRGFEFLKWACYGLEASALSARFQFLETGGALVVSVSVMGLMRVV